MADHFAESPISMISVRTTIADSEPQIWRDLELDSKLRLDQVHAVLQRTFGWRTVHLHQFLEEDPIPADRVLRIGMARRWTPQDELHEDLGALAEEEMTLGELLTDKSGPLFYEYDFGDGWVHRLDFVGRTEATRTDIPAMVVAGENQGPLEDSGGAHGYAELLQTLSDSASDRRDSLALWVEDTAGPWRGFEPTRFDVDDVNSELGLLFGGAEESPSVRACQDIIDRIYEGVRPELRSLLRAVDRAQTSLNVETKTRMVAPYTWLLRRIGTDGVKLSAAGWLPPAIVTEAMTELGWMDDWFGVGNREELTGPVRELRESAQAMRLVRVQKGVLSVPKSGASLIEDSEALWDTLAKRVTIPARLDAERDATLLYLAEIAAGRRSSDRDIRRAVAWGVGALGWRMRDGESIDEFDVISLTREPARMCERIGAFSARHRGRFESDVTPEGRAFAAAALNYLA